MPLNDKGSLINFFVQLLYISLAPLRLQVGGYPLHNRCPTYWAQSLHILIAILTHAEMAARHQHNLPSISLTDHTPQLLQYLCVSVGCTASLSCLTQPAISLLLGLPGFVLGIDLSTSVQHNTGSHTPKHEGESSAHGLVGF